MKKHLQQSLTKDYGKQQQYMAYGVYMATV